MKKIQDSLARFGLVFDDSGFHEGYLQCALTKNGRGVVIIAAPEGEARWGNGSYSKTSTRVVTVLERWILVASRSEEGTITPTRFEKDEVFIVPPMRCISFHFSGSAIIAVNFLGEPTPNPDSHNLDNWPVSFAFEKAVSKIDLSAVEMFTLFAS